MQHSHAETIAELKKAAHYIEIMEQKALHKDREGLQTKPQGMKL